jgi:hypothetical protein
MDIMTRLADLTPPMHPDYSGLQKSKTYIQQFYRSIKEKYVCGIR